MSSRAAAAAHRLYSSRNAPDVWPLHLRQTPSYRLTLIQISGVRAGTAAPLAAGGDIACTLQSCAGMCAVKYQCLTERQHLVEAPAGVPQRIDQRVLPPVREKLQQAGDFGR